MGFGVGSCTSESFGLPQRQPATLALIMVVRSFFFLLDEDIEVGGGGRYKETPYCLGLSALREREGVWVRKYCWLESFSGINILIWQEICGNERGGFFHGLFFS